MIVVDLNLLLYFNDISSPLHARAKLWAEEAVAAGDPIRILWTAIVGFLRIVSHPRLQRSLSPSQTVEAINEWLEPGAAEPLTAGPRHREIFRRFIKACQVRVDLFTDARLAALAIENNAVLHANDRDFSRFPGLKVRYPLQESAR